MPIKLSKTSLIEKNKLLQKQLNETTAKLKTIEQNNKKNEKTTCRDCGSSKAKERKFSFGSAGSFRSVLCDTCWTKTLYEDLLD